MTLGYDVARVLPGLRAHAESLMTDTVSVSRESAPVLNEATGQLEPTVTVVYSGPAQLKMASEVASEVDAGGQLLDVMSPILKLPIETPAGAVGSTADVRSGDLFEVVASRSDAANVGRSGRIAGIPLRTLATARRLPVEIDG